MPGEGIPGAALGAGAHVLDPAAGTRGLGEDGRDPGMHRPGVPSATGHLVWQCQHGPAGHRHTGNGSPVLPGGREGGRESCRGHREHISVQSIGTRGPGSSDSPVGSFWDRADVHGVSLFPLVFPWDLSLKNQNLLSALKHHKHAPTRPGCLGHHESFSIKLLLLLQFVKYNTSVLYSLCMLTSHRGGVLQTRPECSTHHKYQK